MTELKEHLKLAITMLEDRLGVRLALDINMHLLAVLDGIGEIDKLFDKLAAAMPPEETAAREDRAA